MSTGPKQGWGGKRTGSGRKPLPRGEKLIRYMVRTQRRWEKLMGGETMDDILMMIIYGRGADKTPIQVDPKTRVVAIKLFKELVGGDHEEKVQVPPGGLQRGRVLPDMRPDPAEKIPEKIGNA